MLFLAFSELVASAEKLLYTVSIFQYHDKDSGGPWKSQRNIFGYVRPFLARKTFQDNFGFEGQEGQKKSWEKKSYLTRRFFRKKSSPKFHKEIKARILPAEEIFEPKKFWRQEEILQGNFCHHLIIELKSVQYEVHPFPVLDDAYCCTYTRLCSLLYSHMHRLTQTLPQEP